MLKFVGGFGAGLVVALLIVALAAFAAVQVRVLRCRAFADPYGGDNLACSVKWSECP